MQHHDVASTLYKCHVPAGKGLENVINSFAVNTINILIECNETSIFSRVRSTKERLNVFIT